MVGKCLMMKSAGLWLMSRYMQSPRRFISWSMARATMSPRGQLGPLVKLRHEAAAVGTAQVSPSPRSASVSRKLGSSGWNRLVGWNWLNSRFATRQPARHAMAMPSPELTSGLEVYWYTLEAAGGQRHEAGADHLDLLGVAIPDA